MAEYLVRKAKYGTEIAKFEDSSYPIDVYSVSSSRCGCPARTRSCKHIRIVKAWEKADKKLGLVFDDNADIIGNIFSNESSGSNWGF